MDYQAELKAHGILISISGQGNCFDNAMIETFFKMLKSGLVWRTAFKTRVDAEKAISCTIEASITRPAPFRARLHKPRTLREDGCYLTRCLSTKVGQVQDNLTAAAVLQGSELRA